MNKLKRTLALVATLAMATTAFVGCGKEESSSSSSSSKAEESSSEAEESSEVEESSASSGAAGEVGEIDASVGTGGSTFTVAAWNADDVPYLIAQWKGCSVEDVSNGKVDGVNFVNFGVGGGDASEKYDALFNSGDDLDVYFCEADWALKYINDDTKTLALDKLGFTDSSFPNIYSYTDEIGKDANGVRKGVSWQAAAGGFAYRTDLAEQYLGVTSPEEMQAAVADWDKFVESATTVSEKSGGKTALADTLGGMWQVFAAGRTSAWVQDNKLVIDDSCEKFANIAKTLWDNGGVTKNTQWSDEWYASGQDDSAMGFFVSTWGFGDAILTKAAGGEGGASYGKWNVCVGPNEYFWGGTWIVVNPATDNGQEAQDFIKMATVDEDQMLTYATTKPEYVNNQNVMQKVVDDNIVTNEYVSGNLGGQNYFAELHESAKGINLNGLITPYDATIKTDFINAVQTEMLEGGKSWEDTQEAFKDKVAEDVTTLDWDE